MLTDGSSEWVAHLELDLDVEEGALQEEDARGGVAADARLDGSKRALRRREDGLRRCVGTCTCVSHTPIPNRRKDLKLTAGDCQSRFSRRRPHPVLTLYMMPL